jgi:RNA polymerase sigma factor (sigma-70 family)
MTDEYLLKLSSNYNISQINEFTSVDAEDKFLSPIGVTSSYCPESYQHNKARFTFEEEKKHFYALHFLKYKIHEALTNKLPYDKLLFVYHGVRSRIVSANIRLAFKCVKRFLYKKQHEEDSLASDAALALMRCADCYDPWKKNHFSTYVYWGILKTFSKKQKTTVNLDCDMPDVYGIEIDDNKKRAEKETFIIQKVQDVLHSPSDLLNKTEQFVIEHRFGLGNQECLTLKEIGKMLGICAERVRQVQEEALEKLHNIIRDDL